MKKLLPNDTIKAKYLNNYGSKFNILGQIAIDILNHFQTMYNYGVRYGILVNEKACKKFNGTVNSDSWYSFKNDGFHIIVTRMAPIKQSKVLKKVLEKIVTEVVSKN